jgi:hypothetical protein
LQRGGREAQNTWNRYEVYGDRRGDAARAAPGCPFTSIDIISHINVMNRE